MPGGGLEPPTRGFSALRYIFLDDQKTSKIPASLLALQRLEASRSWVWAGFCVSGRDSIPSILSFSGDSMTTFNAANDLPATINSLAKLVAWSAGAYWTLLRTSEYQESQNGVLVPLATLQDGTAGDETERAIFRISLQLETGWRASPQPYWVNVISPTSAPIPPSYLP